MHDPASDTHLHVFILFLPENARVAYIHNHVHLRIGGGVCNPERLVRSTTLGSTRRINYPALVRVTPLQRLTVITRLSTPTGCMDMDMDRGMASLEDWNININTGAVWLGLAAPASYLLCLYACMFVCSPPPSQRLHGRLTH